MQRVINAVLAFLHFHFGGTTDADHGNATGELRQTFLQLFTVVVRSGFFDLRLDLLATASDLVLLTSAINDGGVFLLDPHGLGAAELSKRDAFQLDAKIFADHFTTGQDRDVFEHRLATITEARRLDGRDLQATAQLVDHEGRERFAFHIFGHDHERTAGLHNRFEQRQHRLKLRQLLFEDQDIRIVHFRDHLFRIRDEIRGDIAAVELHAFNDIKFGLDGLGFFNRDDAFIADLFHGLGNHFADLGFAIGGKRANLRHFGRSGDLAGLGFKLGHDMGNCLVDTALKVHRVHAGGNRLRTFAHDSLCKHGCSGGAVARRVIGLGGNFAHHLRAHIFELVSQFDFLRYRHTVLGDARRAEAFVDDDIAALGTEGDLYSVGQDIHAAEHPLPRVGAELNVLSSHVCVSFSGSDWKIGDQAVRMPMTSDSFMIRSSSPFSFTSVPDHLPKRMRSPALTSSGRRSPFSFKVPEPTATTSPSCGFSLAVSGMMIPPALFSSAVTRRTRTRSCRGRKVIRSCPEPRVDDGSLWVA